VRHEHLSSPVERERYRADVLTLTCPDFSEPFIPGEGLWVDESVRVDIAA
jgi:hypothetical protein